ncbi:Myb-like_DNA-binding domain-containing protein [Hexamita inflata]|uniref:Myb-like DNA-binding domain-containing protein n=1 Tax=Hexamita inflata TaxID=28002 RepID=A0AA86QLC0_9EUKA|nr:Myb-like DNA-binding domain-containing protein [Hexamita inflata]
MKKQVIQNKWSDDEREKLQQLVKQYTQNNRTQWTEVSKFMDRSPNQCKTQYSIVISRNAPKNCNVQWTIDQKLQLIQNVAIYGKKWELIRKVDILSQFTAEQLRQKYLFFQNNKLLRTKMLEKIITTDQLNPKEFNERQVELYTYMYKKFCAEKTPLEPLENQILQKAFQLNEENINIREALQKIFEKLPELYQQQLINLNAK